MEPQDLDRTEPPQPAPEPQYAPPALEELGTFADLTELSSAGANDFEGLS